VNLQLDHFPMIKTNPNQKVFSVPTTRCWRSRAKTHKTPLAARGLILLSGGTILGARLSQRVAMDDLASYFVEERSKVR